MTPPPAEPEAVRGEQIRHLSRLTQTLPGGLCYPIVAIGGGGPRMLTAVTAATVEPTADLIETHLAQNLYVNTSPIPIQKLESFHGSNRRGGAGDVAALTHLWLDIDVEGPAHNADVKYPCWCGAQFLLFEQQELIPEPTLWLWSGNGWQALWQLETPLLIVDEPARAKAAGYARGWNEHAAAVAARTGHQIDQVGDLPRILRIAGTLNHKSAPAKNCVLGSSDGPSYTLEQLTEFASTTLVERQTLADAQRAHRPAQRPAQGRSTALTGSSGGGDLNILEVLDSIDWVAIWPDSWEHVDNSSVDGAPVERWRRPGASSHHSATCWPDGGCTVFSAAVPGLPAGHYSKAQVLAWALGLDWRDTSGVAVWLCKGGAR